MEEEDKGIPDKGHSISDFGSSKSVAATGIWQAWRERGRVGGGEHGQ